jgi:hypothetical protein
MFSRFTPVVDKLRHGFLWAKKNEANNGNSLMAWDGVCAPKLIGVLARYARAAVVTCCIACAGAWWFWWLKTYCAKTWSGNGMHFDMLSDSTTFFNDR